MNLTPRALLATGTCLLVLATTLTGCPRFEDPPERPDPTDPNQANQVDPSLRCPVELAFPEAQDASLVTVAGAFNDWDITADEMTRSGGAWRTELELAPGHYPFKFVIDGSYEGDPPPFVYTHWSGDVENRNLIVENCSRPGLTIDDLQISPTGLVEGTILFERSLEDAPINPESLQITLGSHTVTPDISGDQITFSHQLSDHGKYSLRVRARDEDNRPTRQNPLWIPLWHEEEQFHWFDSTMYLIFTDRFRTAGQSPLGPIDGVPSIANYKGGNFGGITEAIDEGYFDDLGINLLWLNPINENTNLAQPGSFDDNVYTAYHGYWTVDPLSAETRFGDTDRSGDEALHEMIQAAHDRGIRVMVDLVLNHVHQEHIYCQNYPNWCQITCVCGDFGCGWDERTRDCQFAPYLPNLNYRNHDIVERVVEDALALIEKFDIDAIRIDAAKHMEHVIMRTLRLRLNELEAQGASPFYVIGETFTGEDGRDEIMAYVADWELHSQFDFPLLYPIRRVFGHGASFQELETGLNLSEAAYGETYPWHSPFVGNHDIPRFVTEFVGNGEGPFGSTPDLMAQGPQSTITEQWIIDRVSMAHAFLYTIPGIPLLYYGDEIGLAGDHDPDNRRRMQWDLNANQQALLSRLQDLGQARRALPALRYGDRQEVWIDPDFYVYVRDDGPGRRAVIALNKAEEPRSEGVLLPSAWGGNVTLTDHLSSTVIQASDGEVTISLDPWTYAIFDVQE